jgi:SAM-dependent methyltransferase
MQQAQESLAAERRRIVAEFARRAAEEPTERYAPWDPSSQLIESERARMAAAMLRRAACFPGESDRCLEIGCGSLGWFPELIRWRVASEQLCGIDLSESRVDRLRRALPGVDVRAGDATTLPWADSSFRVVIASTVFTSILDATMRRLVAGEIQRVLRPGGALLWYDFAWNNPRNPNVRGIGRSELRALFPALSGEIRALTLAPPLARLVAPVSWRLATVLAAIPGLRTHLLAVLKKERS